MNVLSLFDGISCGRVALDKAGIKVDNYFSSEIDENPIEISNRNYPDIVRLGDINGINIKVINELPKIDLILAGSPCQGFSRNGKGLNFDDPRSRLFFKFVEILACVKFVNNPNAKFILENVMMKKEWMNVITEYVKVDPLEINSKLVSGQNRPRAYWTDIPHEELQDRGVLLSDILESDEDVEYIEHQGIKICSSFKEAHRNLVNVIDGQVRVSQATKQGYKVAEDGDGVNLSFPTSRTRRGRVISQKTGTLDCSCDVAVYKDGKIRRLTLRELERLQTLPEEYTEGVSDSARRKAIGNGWTVDVIAHLLGFLK